MRSHCMGTRKKVDSLIVSRVASVSHSPGSSSAASAATYSARPAQPVDPAAALGGLAQERQAPLRELVAGLAPDEGRELLHQPAHRVSRRRRAISSPIADGREDELRRAELDRRARHAEDRRARLVLGAAERPGPAQVAQSFGAVGSHAGEQDRHDALRRAGVERAEELVGRGAMPAPRRRDGVELEPAVGAEAQVRIRRARCAPLPARAARRRGRRGHRGRGRGQPLGEAALEAGGDVLHDEDRQRCRRRQRGEQIAHRRRSAGRGADREAGETPAPARGAERPGRGGRGTADAAARSRDALPPPRPGSPPAGSRRAGRQLSGSSGFGSSSTAPEPSAWKAARTSERSAREVRRIVGTGRSRRRRASTPKPSSCGITMSSRRTSGRSRSTSSTAASPSAASPMTWMSAAWARKRRSTARTDDESSTIRTVSLRAPADVTRRPDQLPVRRRTVSTRSVATRLCLVR